MKSGRRIAHSGQPQDNRRTIRDTRHGTARRAPRAARRQHDGEGRLAAAFVAYFSLISRRRSSRKPWAVIASGYRLGLSAVMHEGSTSIRKSGFGCRKNGTE